MIGSLNINHPLPMLWNVKFSKRDELKKKIIYAFQILKILKKNTEIEHTINDFREKE